jgi:ribosomal protein S27AE
MSETCLERWMRHPHFTCPRCLATSWNASDIANRYCGRCHVFFAPFADLREGAPHDPTGVHQARQRAVEATRPHPRERAREDDATPSPFTFSPAPDPPSAAPDPSPSSIDPGGGTSGGGGASGDF